MATNKDGATVTRMHKALHDFVGNWRVTQKLWSSPGAEPVTNRGKTKCSLILDGLATLMVTEMDTSNFKGIAVITYNSKESRYDLAWIDSNSGQGFTLMAGQPSKNKSRSALRSEFGKTASEVRSWSTSVGTPNGGALALTGASAAACLPGDSFAAASQFAAAGERAFAAEGSARRARAGAARGDSEVELSLVENKISDNKWVLEFYVPGPNGEQFLVMQNTFTRSGRQ